MPRVTISIKDKQAQPYRFPLDRETVTLGRGSDNDIAIQSGSVSVHHAKMSRVPGGYELCDMESTNGIKLDGERKERVSLQSGMTVGVGDAEFFFQLTDEEQEELKREMPTGRLAVENEGGKTKMLEAGEDGEEEVEEDDEEKPKKKSKKQKRVDDDASAGSRSSRAQSPAVVRRPQTSGSGGVVFVVFLILAIVAFCVGVAIRFQKETGKPLIDTVRSRFESGKVPVGEPQPEEQPEIAE